ncbi:thiamine diphosphokinase [Pseudolactococcus insecticola]|nr:thiamine diphosphokinase [Lactococcus insecticola]
MRIIILAGGPASGFDRQIKALPNFSDSYFVGVDRGAFRLMTAGFPVDLAIGDFDSLTADELGLVKDYAGKWYQAPAEKDDTDLELAVLTATEQVSEIREIIIFGGLGGRFDHEIQIFYLPLQARFASLAQKIVLMNETNHISFRGEGTHVLTKIPEMTYLAFASLTAVSGFFISDAKYPLSKTDFPKNFSLSSNEFLDNKPVTIGLEKGIVAVIQSRD